MAAAPFYDFAMIFIPLPILPRPSIAAASIGYPSPSPLLDALNSPSIAIFISPLSDASSTINHTCYALLPSRASILLRSNIFPFYPYESLLLGIGETGRHTYTDSISGPHSTYFWYLIIHHSIAPYHVYTPTTSISFLPHLIYTAGNIRRCFQLFSARVNCSVYYVS